MINTIPNPKKSFQIDKKPEDVASAVENLVLYTDKYKLFKKNDLLKLFTFEASEFLSLGVYIDVNLSSVDANRTEVTIEVKRKVGTFNQTHEVSLANDHIVKITELISHSLIADPSIRLKEIEDQKQRKEDARREELRRQGEWIEKNPTLYKLKIAGMWAFIIVVFGGIIYSFYYFIIR